MKSRVAKTLVLLGCGFIALLAPEFVYKTWDGHDEHSPVADQLRGLSSYHEHYHAAFLKTEHRRHYEAFDFKAPYQTLKPIVQAMFVGPGWKATEEVDYIEYENVGEGRVGFIRLAKNQNIGMVGDRDSGPSGDLGRKPWAVVMYKNTWFDDFMFRQWGNPFFLLISPYSCGYCLVVVLLLLPLVKRRKPDQKLIS